VRKITMIWGAWMVAMSLVPAAAFGQDMSPEQQEAMMKAITPGEHHKHLAQFAGTYTYTSKMWMAPGAPPQESAGKSEAAMILGGRYLQDSVKGEYMGMPFEGMAWTGYDNINQEYKFVWIDNFGTGVTLATGKCSDAGKTITFEGKAPYPGMPDGMPFKEVLRLVDAKKHVMEWYMPSENGDMFKTMEITYTRVK
jgi:hypothetical protein